MSRKEVHDALVWHAIVAEHFGTIKSHMEAHSSADMFPVMPNALHEKIWVPYATHSGLCDDGPPPELPELPELLPPEVPPEDEPLVDPSLGHAAMQVLLW